MFTPLITHDSDGTALAAPVNAARCNGAAYKTRTIGDLRIKDDRLRAAIEGTGHLLFDGGMGTMLQAAGMKAVGVNPDTNLVEVEFFDILETVMKRLNDTASCALRFDCRGNCTGGGLLEESVGDGETQPRRFGGPRVVRAAASAC